MIVLLNLALFMLSLAGWCVLLSHHFSLRIELTPFVALSGMGALLYLAGLLNLYAPAEAALALGGLVLLVLYLFKERSAFTPWLSLRTLVLGLSAGWMLFLMRGAVLFGHDNMSHWGIMAKTMIRFDRLPNTQNTAIEFVGYPPGISGVIKYFCDFVGTSDGMMMYAQGLVLLAGVFALLVFCHPGHIRGLALWGVTAVFLLTADVTPADLRVDTLLAVQAAGALAVIGYYGAGSPRKAALASMPGLLLLAVTKNSGLFFVVLDLAVLTWFMLRNKSRRQTNGPLLLASWAVPLGGFVLWLRHVAMVFPAGDTSKHAVSLGGYESIFGGKTPEDIRTFNGLFFRHLVDFSQADTRCMFALVLVGVLACLWLWRSGALSARYTVQVGLALAAGEVLYLGCLWATYAFSMNTNEMLVLASISRYHLTGLLYFGAALAILLLFGLGRVQNRSPLADAALCTLAMVLVFGVTAPGQAVSLVSRTPYRNTATQAEMLRVKEECGLQEGKRYLFYTRGDPELDTWSMRYVARYVLNTDTVDFWQFPEQEYGYEDLFGQYDYLVLYAPDEDSRDFLEEGFFDPDAPVIELIQ